MGTSGCWQLAGGNTDGRPCSCGLASFHSASFSYTLGERRPEDPCVVDVFLLLPTLGLVGAQSKRGQRTVWKKNPGPSHVPGQYLSALEGPLWKSLSATRNRSRVIKQFTELFFFQNENSFIEFHGNDTYFYDLEYVLRMSIKVLALLLPTHPGICETDVSLLI